MADPNERALGVLMTPLAKQGLNSFCRCRVCGCGRFIQQEDLRGQLQGSHELNDLSFAPREIFDVLLQQVERVVQVLKLLLITATKT